MGVKACLVNPWVYDFAAFDYWAKPLGLLRTGSYLRDMGFEVSLLDCLDMNHPGMKTCFTPKQMGFGRVEYYREEIEKPGPLKGIIPRKYKRYGWPEKLFISELEKKYDTDIFFVSSMMTYWYPGVWRAIDLIRKIQPSAKIVLGGIYSRLCRVHAEKAGADCIINNKLELDRFLRDVTGIKPDHASEHYPCFDLYNSPGYIVISASSGCPDRCSYCASGILDPEYIKKDIDHVCNQIKHWADNYNVRDFAFYDDALLHKSEEHFIPLMKKIMAMTTGLRFHTPNGLHVRHLTPSVAAIMKVSGFRTIRLSLESSDDRFHQRHGAKVSSSEFETGVTNLTDAGYRPEELDIYVIAGLPGQKATDVKKTINFAKGFGLKPRIAEYSPVPGTRLFHEAAKTSPFDLSGEPLFHNNTILPCRSADFSIDDLNELKAFAAQN